MARIVFSKLSGLSLRAHRYFDRLANAKPGFQPYRLNYTPCHSGKKIVHVIGNFIVGGSTQLVVDIIEGTSDMFRHKIVVPAFSEPLAYQPVDISAFSISELSELSDWLSNEKPELVHIHYFARASEKYSDGALWYKTIFRICEELGLKVIQNVNIPTNPNPSSAVIHNVFVSEYVERKFNNTSVPHSVIYPGSNFDHFQNDDPESLPAKSIGMVYRLDDDKLREDAIEVFIEVAKRDRQILCYIVGGGKLRDGFKKRVRKENLGNQIIFEGFVSYEKLPSVYKKFSIFVAPVHVESFGQVTPFAMSMGLCVAGYDTGAISEILGTKDTLVETGDVSDLADLIDRLVQDSELRKKLGRANIVRSRNLFSLEKMITEYRELYSALLDK